MDVGKVPNLTKTEFPAQIDHAKSNNLTHQSFNGTIEQRVSQTGDNWLKSDLIPPTRVQNSLTSDQVKPVSNSSKFSNEKVSGLFKKKLAITFIMKFKQVIKELYQYLTIKIHDSFKHNHYDQSSCLSILENALEIEKKELQKQFSLHKNYIPPKLHERMALMVALRVKLECFPDRVIEEIKLSNHDPLFKKIGAVKFLGILAKIDENIAKSNVTSLSKPGLQNDNLSNFEKVALFGYTTEDYRIINTTLRKSKGRRVRSPGLSSYIHHLKSALSKLPDIQIPPPNQEIKRTIFSLPNANWAEETFNQSIYCDFACSSATNKFTQGGAVNLTFIPAEGATHMHHVKSIGFPYHFYGDKEAEILIEPGTSFEIINVGRSSDGVIHSATLRLIPE